MQPHDPQHPDNPPALSDSASHSLYPDDVSRTENSDVSTSYAPQTARRTKTGVVVGAAFLALCFLVVIVIRYFHAHAVATAGENAYSSAPSVDVVIAKAATAGQALVLPGETAAWYETTLYARVNGYVA
ncbi:MAG TPA: hypothetical protein VKG05_01565, partial [Steroidobacteraceae bacterium]|nr:hypothetical protein [Steroidobacteraceae bacterium]